MSTSNDPTVRVELGKIVLTEHLDVRLHHVALYGQYEHKVWVHVDDKPIITCMHVVCSAPEDEFRELNSVDELIQNHKVAADTVRVEPETLLQLHASSLQAWVEHGYDSALIDSRIAHPVLKALADAGDKKAAEKYLESVLDRWQQGNMRSRAALLLFNQPEVVELNKQRAIDRNEFFSTISDPANEAMTSRYYVPKKMVSEMYKTLVTWETATENDRVRMIGLDKHHEQLYYLASFGLIDSDDLFSAADPRAFYNERGGSVSIVHFVFDLQRPREDPPNYASFSPATLQLIEDHGGFDALRTAWASGKCSRLPWMSFLQSIVAVEEYRFKGSKYIPSSVRVYVRSDLVSPSQYVALEDDGWHVVGSEWMTEEDYAKLVEERQEAERERKMAAKERHIAARASKKKKTRSTVSSQDTSSSTKLEDFTR